MPDQPSAVDRFAAEDAARARAADAMVCLAGGTDTHPNPSWCAGAPVGSGLDEARA